MFKYFKTLIFREKTSQREKIISAALLFIYLFLAARLSPHPSAFYENLIKPSATPAEWGFSVIWLILFILIAASGYYAWNHYKSKLWRKWYMILYALNGFLIYLWSYLFFGNQLIVEALYAAIGLIIVAELMIIFGFKINSKSGYLLLPYLAWLLFAAYLNVNIIVLNG